MTNEHIDCREIRRRLSEGLMDDAIAFHLAGCTPCLRFLSEEQALEQGIGNLARLSPSPDFAAEVMSRIQREKAPKTGMVVPFFAKRLSMVASSVAAVCLLVIAGWAFLRPPVVEYNPAANAPVAVNPAPILETAIRSDSLAHSSANNPAEEDTALTENSGAETLSDAVGF